MRITWALVFMLPFALAGAREDFRKALRLQKQGDTARANIAYRAVLEADPNHRAARRALGYRRTKDGWARTPGERDRADAALKRTWARAKATREQGVLEILALERKERVRALIIALRNRHLDVRLAAIDALGKSGAPAAIKPLTRHLAVAGGSGQRSYIAQTTQISFIRDYDVEIA